MGISKKGSRLIKVNDLEYRWVVKSDDYGMSLVVESAENPGQRMITWLEYGNIISPGLVRKAILYAIDRGWHPQEKGQQIVFRLEGIISRDSNWTGVPSEDRDNRNAVISEPEAVLQQVFRVSQNSLRISACPVCKVDVLGCWDRTEKPIKQEIKGVKFVARGVWEWCSNCHTFYQQRSKKQ
ncbi:MAG: hypothetical protein MUE44_20640 [Oscillatoriaceae cyanobacterium Prado104]|jgi:hypothetical protein|nr:hypothetical protein [Oscillatoriaceae cyanobacterium Prado104]